MEPTPTISTTRLALCMEEIEIEHVLNTEPQMC